MTQQKIPLTSLGILIAIAGLPVSAALVTWNFEGVMTTTDVDFDAGDTFYGHFTFESTTPGTPQGTNPEILNYLNAITDFEMNFPDKGYQFTAPSRYITVYDDAAPSITFDRFIANFDVGISSSGTTLPSVRSLSSIQLDFYSFTEDFISGPGLPTTPFDLNNLTVSGGRFRFVDNSQPQFTISSIPEPSGATLVALTGLALLLGRRR